VIKRANPNSRAFVELEGYRFKRLFVAYGACLNGFILGCRKILFVNRSHLNGPYEGTLLGAVALNDDNHQLDVVYAAMLRENNDDWLWFLNVLHECLGGMKHVITSDRHKSIVYALPRMLGLENHC